MRNLWLFALAGCVVEANTDRTEDGSVSDTGTAQTDSAENEAIDESACQGSEPVLDLVCGTVTGSMAASTHGDDHVAYSCNEYGQGVDQMYRFVCGGSGEVGFFMRPGCDFDLVLLDTACDLGGGCLEASSNAGNQNELVVASCEPGRVFHLSVEGWGIDDPQDCGSSGSYEIEVSGDGC